MGDENSFLHRPWSRVIIILVGAFFLYAVAAFSGHVDYLTVLRELYICLFGLVFWVFFFAQFILPVRKLRDRLSIVDRLWLYIGEEVSRKNLWKHGPAIFVQNGVMRFREGELDERGPGVLWLDSASAVLLRTNTAYTRVEGPGLVFTKRGEYIAATMDLHPIKETLGPASSPFDIAPDDEKFKEFEEKRWQTLARTRDGIEIVAQIEVTYRIDNSKNDSQGRFVFNREAAYVYMTSNITPGSSNEKPVMSTLPGKLAVDLWREYLGKFTFDELFGYSAGPVTPQDVQPKFQMITGLINDRLGKDEVDKLDDYGRKTEEKSKDPLEARQLREMGLKASIVLKGVFMPTENEQKLINRWSTNWLNMARKQSDYIDHEERLNGDLGREDAIREFGLHASRVVAQNAESILGQKYKHKRSHIMELVVQGHFSGIVQKPEIHKRMTDEARTLSEMITWLRERRAETPAND